MNATHTTVTASATLETTTCSQAYFCGVADGRAYAFGSASLRQVVASFSRAVAAGRAAKAAFRAYAAGWVVAEAVRS